MTFVLILISSLLIPAIMLAFGRYFQKRAPKNINYVFGYRTRRSMQNEKTWQFAHEMIGKLWSRLGWLSLVATVPLFFFTNASDDTIGNVGSIIMIAQTFLIILSIIPVERALKKRFDDDGNERQ